MTCRAVFKLWSNAKGRVSGIGLQGCLGNGGFGWISCKDAGDLAKESSSLPAWHGYC